MKVVHQCYTTASTTTPEAVKAELVDILRWMQVILDTYIQPKIDYDKSIDDTRVFFALCSASNPSVSQVFILNSVV